VITNTAYTEGSKANCLLCHKDKSASHVPDHQVSGYVTGAAQCTSCHDQAGNNNDAQYLTTIHGTCGKCHVNASGGGALHDYSGGGSTLGDNINYEGINGGAGGSCVTCHTPYNADFDGAHNTKDHQTEAAADVLTNTASCTTNCHDGTNLTSILTTIHTNDCTNCHTNTGGDGSLRAGTNGTAAGHTIDSQSNCASCHDDNSSFKYTTEFSSLVTGHKVQDHTGMSGAATCTTNCHNAATVGDIIFFTHNSTCTNCHVNTGDNGRLTSGLNGDATGGAGACTSCHGGAYNYDSDFEGAHDGEDHRNAANTTDMLPWQRLSVLPITTTVPTVMATLVPTVS
jgi:hypothetical protein